jgi:hypothetical protein
MHILLLDQFMQHISNNLKTTVLIMNSGKLSEDAPTFNPYYSEKPSKTTTDWEKKQTNMGIYKGFYFI